MKKSSVCKPRRKLCPICNSPMKRRGKIRVGPRRGLRQVYVCPNCASSYKSL